ncbi:NADH dehydrogenase [ubiquinone] 1 alpha subcomplex subunit 8-B [Gracilariopsis chorda]|uniref:NADH dehydrogenase [ubiquinone] 1 alpha subcomplex subunit 8-B n=1 Tax=Gracilariopsis chorda TaxID=448386 RepID=A0A2V3J433_9FLOR|nr:NADH dehydrogenase [ubiquinone] 1 alpha subcomplex subunit 8-B [Gracilariopsis chorda]|eukprot:PXF49139.1 NADH dehydrogenase [ubiquinone] 1 alpha subcomplex subunit 8-B [Gracilariopsis chorda]
MATSSVLYAAAKEIGATCDAENRAFLKCKNADEDPAACLDKGEAVQSCALGVLKSAMATCQKTFQSYATCLDNQISQEYMFERCRKQESAFAECRQKANSSASVVAATPKDPSPRE